MIVALLLLYKVHLETDKNITRMKKSRNVVDLKKAKLVLCRRGSVCCHLMGTFGETVEKRCNGEVGLSSAHLYFSQAILRYLPVFPCWLSCKKSLGVLFNYQPPDHSLLIFPVNRYKRKSSIFTPLDTWLSIRTSRSEESEKIWS